jgi:hypothetical protein
MLIGSVAAPVVGSLLSDDNGAEGANNAAADSTRLQGEIARDQWNRYKEIYEPLERGLVKDAQDYDSPENYAKAAGDAQATVSSQFGKARDRLGRTPGLDPSTPGAAASMIGLDLAQAATDATQQNAARQRVKDVAYARKTDALSLGKGLAANASSALGSSAQNSLAMAQSGQAQANAQAGAIGRSVDRIFNSGSTSNWLGNVSTANTYGTNIGSQQTNMLQQQEFGM